MPLSRRARFNWWVVVVITALAAPLWMLIGGATAEMRLVATIHQIVVLSAMLWLIESTPSDAIKISRAFSVLLILVGALWMLAVGMEFWMPGTRTLIRAAILGVVIFAFFASATPGSPEPTPWVIALALWHPIVWTPPHDWLAIDRFWLDAILFLCTLSFPLVYYTAVHQRIRFVFWLLLSAAFVSLAAITTVHAPTPFEMTTQRREEIRQTLLKLLQDPDLTESQRREIEMLLNAGTAE